MHLICILKNFPHVCGDESGRYSAKFTNSVFPRVGGGESRVKALLYEVILFFPLCGNEPVRDEVNPILSEFSPQLWG